MENIKNKIIPKDFVDSLFNELSKLPFGSLPKTELELVILHSMIDSYGGYDRLNKNLLFFQKELKLSKTKFNNKVLEAQLRFDTSQIEPVTFFIDLLFKKDISDLIFEDNYLIIYISNPFKRDVIKTYLNSIEILNDESFNNSIIKIHSKGLLKILSKNLNESDLTKIESKIISACQLKHNASFNLIGNINLDSVFSLDFSLDPLKSAKQLIDIIRNSKN
ncbi:MAG: hypothetical protein KA210_08935 [Bacteroidia bacterium]|nr:hypothetical protein [Bacteroidia bacterium]